mmetsp:Transcript_138715/g.276616  ORF Transcript_138715/g.276616 Transcript_138715/m.276616 type:complete len:203 (-) Transcript_138715:417-1025(-)
MQYRQQAPARRDSDACRRCLPPAEAKLLHQLCLPDLKTLVGQALPFAAIHLRMLAMLSVHQLQNPSGKLPHLSATPCMVVTWCPQVVLSKPTPPRHELVHQPSPIAVLYANEAALPVFLCKCHTSCHSQRDSCGYLCPSTLSLCFLLILHLMAAIPIQQLTAQYGAKPSNNDQMLPNLALYELPRDLQHQSGGLHNSRYAHE